jgi:hypothetical protein
MGLDGWTGQLEEKGRRQQMMWSLYINKCREKQHQYFSLYKNTEVYE